MRGIMDEQSEMELNWDSLKEQSLLKGLSEEQILYLYKQSTQEKFLPNEVIIAEGEKTTDVYLILEGEVNILKWDEDHSSEVVIGHLGKGDTFGEMSFMDDSPRSTTVKAAKPAILLKLTKEAVATKDILIQLYENIAIVTINRLRNSNKMFVKNLKTIQHLFQIREHIGHFLIYLYLTLGLAVLLISHFFSGPIETYLPWFVTAIPALYLIKANRFQFSHFGLNARNWLSVLLISCLALVLVVGLVDFVNIFFKLSFIPLIPSEQFNHDWPSLEILPFYAAYAVVQEFVARGVLQTALQDFLHDRSGYKAWFINAIFLFLLLLPLGLQLATHLFLIGLPMGLLYLNQRSILGVALIHFVLLCFFITV
jgi:CRP-like cAMP-binding protein